MSQPRNKFETRLWNSLKKTGRAQYEPEKLPYTLLCEYLPDFVLLAKSGKKIYIEAKGEFDAQARRKMLAVKKQHPELDIRFVFYRAASKIRKGSTTTCGGWARDHDFEYADGSIPKAWMKE